MRTRIDLRNLLQEKTGLCNLYFQSPENTKMKYPCILYEKNDHLTHSADNLNYINRNRYTVTIIGKNPDIDEIQNRLLEIPYCSYDRRYIYDNLYHDVFNIYW